jgi:hypothetical protein
MEGLMMLTTKRWMLAALSAGLVLVPASNAGASPPTAAQQAAFPLLRTPAATRVPSVVQRFVASSQGRRAGVDVRSVRRVDGADGGTWSVLPGTGLICVVFEDHEGIAACASNADAAITGIAALLITPSSVPGSSAVVGPTKEVGLAPASVSRVASSGSAAPLTGDGAYAAHLTGLGRVALIGSDGKRVSRGRPHHAVTGAPAYAKAHVAWNNVYNFCGGPYCYISTSLWGPLLPVGDEHIFSVDGNWICGNLTNTDGSWAGTTFCTTSLQGADHAYNQSGRYPWTGPGVAGVQVYGNAYAWYN